MTNVNTSYPDFSYGEISPRIYGRFDIAAYYKSGRRVRNFITEEVGGAKFRTGSYFVAQTKSNAKAFLYPFVFTDSVAFIMEFTPTKIRFFRDDGIVESTPGVAVEVTTPYAAGDLQQLKFAQDNDILYIAHPSHPPQKLTYTSPTSWALTAHAPVRKTRQPGVLISAISLANPCVITYTGGDVFTNGDTVFIENAAGGGGSSWTNSGGTGGSSIGGNGAARVPAINGTVGTNNRGAGGGAGTNEYTSGQGGTGIVIIRYAI